VGTGVLIDPVGLADNCAGLDGTACVGIAGDAWTRLDTMGFTVGVIVATDGEDCPPAGYAVAVAGTELSLCARYTAPANSAALIASKPNTKLANMDCLFDLDMPASS
jgi:hypothetical protein